MASLSMASVNVSFCHPLRSSSPKVSLRSSVHFATSLSSSHSISGLRAVLPLKISTVASPNSQKLHSFTVFAHKGYKMKTHKVLFPYLSHFLCISGFSLSWAEIEVKYYDLESIVAEIGISMLWKFGFFFGSLAILVSIGVIVIDLRVYLVKFEITETENFILALEILNCFSKGVSFSWLVLSLCWMELWECVMYFVDRPQRSGSEWRVEGRLWGGDLESSIC